MKCVYAGQATSLASRVKFNLAIGIIKNKIYNHLITTKTIIIENKFNSK